MVALYVVLGIIVIIIVAAIIYNKYNNDKIKEAEKSGRAYRALEALNEKYKFREFRGDYKRIYYRSTNAQKYNDSDFAFSCFVKEVVLPDIGIFEDYIEDVEYNKQLFRQYEKEYNQLITYSKNSVEKSLCEQFKARPLLEISYTVELYYRYYNEYRSNTYKYEVIDIQKAIVEARRINLSKVVAKRERAIMSDTLRFQILRRDNFTCQICGKQAKDGVELEVDHIVPISKGGKTVPDNLQTLCRRCNRGKRDSMMYDTD